jgi:hypothetical protein
MSLPDPKPTWKDYIPSAIIAGLLAALFFIGGCQGFDYLIKVDVPTGMAQAVGTGARIPLAEAEFTLQQFETWATEQLRVFDANVQDAVWLHELVISVWDVNVGPTLEGALSGIPFGVAGFSILSWIVGGVLGKKKGTYTTRDEWQKKLNDAIAEQLERLRVEKERSYNKGLEVGRNGGTP